MNLLRILYPVKLLVCAVLFVIIVVFATCSAIAWFPVRLLVRFLANVFRHDLDGMLSPELVFLAQHDPLEKPAFNAVVATVFDGNVSLDFARQTFLDRIFKPLITDPRVDYEFKRLRTTITTFGGFYFWKRVKRFQIEDHIRMYEDVLQEDGSLSPSEYGLGVKKVYTEADLKDIASYLATKKWRKSQSPWEMVILQNFQGNEGNSEQPSQAEEEGAAGLQTVVLYRFHHCLADGYSFLNVIMKFCDYKGSILVTPVFKKRGKCFSLMMSLLLPLKACWDTVLFLADQRFDMNDWLGTPKGPLQSSYITTWSPAIPVDRIKNLKKKFSVNFATVLLSVGTGVLARMMKSTGAKVPGEVSCILPVPLPNRPQGLKNHMTSALLHIPVGESDPGKRLQKTERTIRWQKKIPMGNIVMQKLFHCFCMAPKIFLKLILRLPGITLAFSPFPGLTQPLQLNSECVSRRSLFAFGLSPNGSPFCNMSSLSDMGKIVFTFTGRRHVLSSREQVELFSQFLEEELAALEEASGNIDSV